MIWAMFKVYLNNQNYYVKQEDPEIGNRVIVSCTCSRIEDADFIGFDQDFFDKSTFYWKKREGRRNRTTSIFLFNEDTWSKAFEQAESYFKEECSRYERLVSERELSLKNAE